MCLYNRPSPMCCNFLHTPRTLVSRLVKPGDSCSPSSGAADGSQFSSLTASLVPRLGLKTKYFRIFSMISPGSVVGRFASACETSCMCWSTSMSAVL